MNTYRSNVPQPATRRTARRGLVALALAAAAASSVASGSGPVVAEAVPTVAPDVATTPTIRGCGDLWERILVLAPPEYARASVAESMGFAHAGDWISADGLTWEHIDGRVIVVATPRTRHPVQYPAGCDTGAATDTASATDGASA